MIAAIYHAEGLLQDLSPEERQKERMDKVRPLVDAFFAWVHKISEDKSILMSDKTQEGLQYCLNQESYLLTFLECGEIPLDNNRTEATIRGFTVGRKNWMMCDTISGAKSSAVIYSLVEKRPRPTALTCINTSSICSPNFQSLVSFNPMRTRLPAWSGCFPGRKNYQRSVGKRVAEKRSFFRAEKH